MALIPWRGSAKGRRIRATGIHFGSHSDYYYFFCFGFVSHYYAGRYNSEPRRVTAATFWLLLFLFYLRVLMALLVVKVMNSIHGPNENDDNLTVWAKYKCFNRFLNNTNIPSSFVLLIMGGMWGCKKSPPYQLCCCVLWMLNFVKKMNNANMANEKVLLRVIPEVLINPAWANTI